MLFVPLVLVFGRRAGVETAGAVGLSLPAAGLVLVFPAAGLLGVGDTAAAALALLVAGAALYVALGALLWPSVGRRTRAAAAVARVAGRAEAQSESTGALAPGELEQPPSPARRRLLELPRAVVVDEPVGLAAAAEGAALVDSSGP